MITIIPSLDVFRLIFSCKNAWKTCKNVWISLGSRPAACWLCLWNIRLMPGTRVSALPWQPSLSSKG